MRRSTTGPAISRVLSLVLVVGVLAGLAPGAAAEDRGHVLGGATADSGVFTPIAPTALAAKGPQPAPDSYSPPYGVRFNNPNGKREHRRRIIRHLIRTIDSVPGRERIRIATWNLNSDDITEALVRAHRRGVSVRVVMDRFNANEATPNPNADRLRRVLYRGQKNRKPSQKSLFRACYSSCRYPRGIAHTKFYLFSRAGKKKRVVMYGSANATDLAAGGQWNDLYTFNDQPAFYVKFTQIFNQMMRDRKVKVPYQVISGGPYTAEFYPHRGPGAVGDPVLDILDKVECKGATNGTGRNGRTSIRVAMTSMYADRGTRIANALAGLYERGCDVKIVYAVFGNNVIQIFSHTGRGQLPVQQIVNDYDGDGIYEGYLHMKDLTISGNYNGKTDAEVTWNGSANWTTVGLQSDEIVMKILGKGVRQAYSEWIDYLYSHPPRTAARVAARSALARFAYAARGVDPNRLIEMD